MTDIEMTKLCARAMGYTLWCYSGHWNKEYASTQAMPIRVCGMPDEDYDPLHSDDQAMAVMKKLRIAVIFDDEKGLWLAGPGGVVASKHDAESSDLNRAIVESVAKMQREQSSGDGDR